MPSPVATDCTLNIVPAEFDPEVKFRIGTQPFKSGDQLRELRDAHRGTHFFKRYDNVIACVPLSAGAEPIGDKVVERSAGKVLWLVAPLVLDSILRYFYEHDRPVLSYKPLQVVSHRPGDEFIAKSIPPGTRAPDWLVKRIVYSFDTRTLYSSDDAPLIVVACDVRLRNFISASCEELLKAGVPLESRYVQVRRDDKDPRLAPRSQLVGRVLRVGSGVLSLEDNLEGYETVPTAEAYLEPRRENFAGCLQHLFPEVAEEILNSLEAQAATMRSGPERLRRILSILEHLRGADLQLAPGVRLGLGKLFRRDPSNKWFPRREVIRKPVLVFDPAGSRTDVWNERGIDKHGPYDQRFFSPKIPRIAVVCQAEAQGQVEQFLHKFLEGLPRVLTGRGDKARAPYAKGFIRRYALERVVVEVFPVRDGRAESYLAASRRAIEKAAEERQEWNLAFVQIREDFHQYTGDANPYLVTKSLFMRHQVPVQEVTLEKMRSPNADLVFIMNDISIATYAKLNGIPWLMKADSTIAHELVIGIGSYHLSGSRIGPKERVVGITTVFTGDGNYVLENKTAATPYEEYADALLESLRASVEAIRRDQNWRSSDSIRLIFHTFKQHKDVEVDVVDQVMSELGHPNVKYAFVHFVDDHPFYVFDETNRGVYFSPEERKGIYAPERGLMLKLNRGEALLSFKGARELRQPQDGIPQPVLLRLHRNSTFKDLTYIAHQSFSFSCHSWRTFSPAPLPITILYSELIASLLRNLDDVSEWDADAMLGRIGRMRWFL